MPVLLCIDEAGGKSRETQAYSLTTPVVKQDKDAIEAAVKEAGAGAVLFTMHIDTDTKQHYRPPERTILVDPYYSRMHGYYPMAYREVYTHGYSYSVTTVSFESNLYDAESGRLVWTAQSKSTDPTLTKKYIDEIVHLFFSDLREKNLL